ncbi:hypothetical protein IGI04_013088 [Brassica rapa subsp. trilocularis]|uniref:PB1 domain-containing protein n=1 Tax=Brassica rapa subsp. trilocularis TaxID=1813537 RepID=A0ABQ7N7U1_BRACM|nr:hypothetical protein IGI04_013088 [Brassica rapa subsp. trilocularis]
MSSRVQRDVTDTKRRRRRRTAGNYRACTSSSMGHLVRVVVGDWQRFAHGTWRFDINHVDVKYDLVLKENETYEELVAMVRGKYQIHHTEPVALTYDFPEWMKVPGDYTTPPVDILDDKDVELFMAVRMDFANLMLCVTYGNVDVARYSQIQREEFGLTEDGTDVVPPKPIPWRGFRSGGYLQVSEERLMTICSSEQMEEIRRTAVRLTKREILHPLEVMDGVSSESDSSDEMEVFTQDGEGMIRLEEMTTEQQPEAGLTLAIAINNDVASGSTDKGKGIMTESGMGGGPMFSLQMWSGSGDASEDAYPNPEGAYTGHDVNAGDEGDEEMAKYDNLYVGQVFVDRDAFKASAYSGSIKPVEQANIAVYKFGVDGEDGHLLPPATRRPPGRPRKARFASRGELVVLSSAAGPAAGVEGRTITRSRVRCLSEGKDED